ncbi:hypothetical protein [Paraburkholderia sp.]|uniref:hypothetical protein n=1 Tax=Paraburkholderia sp. TaxID=1926495 RepID=UPI0025EED46A|nr:hypothetical protein [Paraburkholderia sp.]
MTVKELIELLKAAPPDSIVLFMEQFASWTEGEEIQQVDVRPEPWLHERGHHRDDTYEAHIPATLKDPREEAGYHDVTWRPESVVVLSSGPTNLRFPF